MIERQISGYLGVVRGGKEGLLGKAGWNFRDDETISSLMVVVVSLCIPLSKLIKLSILNLHLTVYKLYFKKVDFCKKSGKSSPRRWGAPPRAAPTHCAAIGKFIALSEPWFPPAPLCALMPCREQGTIGSIKSLIIRETCLTRANGTRQSVSPKAWWLNCLGGEWYLVPASESAEGGGK